jgi:ketosteroid isomerase-like protein
MPSLKHFLVACLAGTTLPACGDDDPYEYLLTANELVAIQQAHFDYREAWLANDSAAVMASLTADAVLMPHHGDPVVAGAAAIREFWWPPDSPPATVTAFETSIDEVGGSGDVGYLRGTFSLSFEYGGQTYTNGGNFMEIARKQEDGDWLISHRIWNDPVPGID